MMAQAPRHPEVNQQNTTAFESKNQILPATLERLDGFARELRGSLHGVMRAGQANVGDLDLREGPTDELRLEAGPDRLDLR
jgi:hypothetical protein